MAIGMFTIISRKEKLKRCIIFHPQMFNFEVLLRHKQY